MSGAPAPIARVTFKANLTKLCNLNLKIIDNTFLVAQKWSSIEKVFLESADFHQFFLAFKKPAPPVFTLKLNKKNGENIILKSIYVDKQKKSLFVIFEIKFAQTFSGQKTSFGFSLVNKNRFQDFKIILQNNTESNSSNKHFLYLLFCINLKNFQAHYKIFRVPLTLNLLKASIKEIIFKFTAPKAVLNKFF